jgi:hypothetical protein
MLPVLAFADLLCDVSMEYLNMGYTGQAGVALDQAKLLMNTGFAKNETDLSWNSIYAFYLMSSGNIEKRCAFLKFRFTIC